MAQRNKKSAKDLAFERERTRLLSVIKNKNTEILSLKQEANKYKAQAESWEKTAKILESKLGVPAEEIIADIERHKRICGFIDPFVSVAESYLK